MSGQIERIFTQVTKVIGKSDEFQQQLGQYRLDGERIVDIWEEYRGYIDNAIDYIKQILNYSLSELLNMHEIDFFKTLRRAEKIQRAKIEAQQNKD